MSPEFMNLLSTGGAGIAVTVVTFIFLRFLRDERNQLMADRREERQEFLQRLDDISVRLEQLAEKLGETVSRPNAPRDEHRPPRTQQ